MARHIGKRRSGPDTRATKGTPSLGLIVTPHVARPKRVATRPPAQEETIEDRLAAKADLADKTDFTGQRSLGQMTRAERRTILFGV
jgi:hypothetical protein